MVAEKKKHKRVSYRAKVGCWNCDKVYEIAVKFGESVGKYIVDKKMVCRECKCDSLKMYKEYKINNKIMKDIILHDRLEHMNDEPKGKPNHDAFK